MTPQSRLMTAEDLLELPDDGLHHELINGELTSMTPPGGPHSQVTSRLHLRLGNFVEAHALGEVPTGEPGFILQRNPDTVRAPDVAFLAADRVPGGRLPAGYITCVPNLVVEVVSPNDRAGEVQAKVLQWLAAGVQQVWVVCPDTRSVVVHARGFTATLGEGETLTGDDVLPGFSCPVRDIFPPF